MPIFTKPYERRNVCVLPASSQTDHRANVVSRCTGGNHTHFTRAKVVDAVSRGEMRWLDKFHNTACYTYLHSGEWQKTRSGPVATMQFKLGAKARRIPANQRPKEPEETI